MNKLLVVLGSTIIIFIAVIGSVFYIWKPWIPEKYRDPLYCDELIGCIKEWDTCMNEYHYTGSDDRWLLLDSTVCECENNRCVETRIEMLYNQKTVCKGDARCLNGTVTNVIDGDTIEIDGVTVRLALVDAPEYGEEGYNESKLFVTDLCLGAPVVVDEDDGQNESYGRLVGVVYYNSKNLNAALVNYGFAEIDSRFCDVSEFADEEWTGC